MSHYSCSRWEGRRGEVLIAFKSTKAYNIQHVTVGNVGNLIWCFALLIVEKYLVHFYRCVYYIEDYVEISVSWTDVWSNVQQDLFLFFSWSYLGCILRSVHRDDRIATGSGNISDERFRGEVVTTFGMSFIFLCWPHFLRVTLITAQIKIWHVLFSLCKIDSTKSPNFIIDIIFCQRIRV